jgi:hypothetical protein
LSGRRAAVDAQRTQADESARDTPRDPEAIGEPAIDALTFLGHSDFPRML